jgi:hypothetical protein
VCGKHSLYDKPFLSDETMNIKRVRNVGLSDRDYMKPGYNKKSPLPKKNILSKISRKIKNIFKKPKN